MSAVDNGVAQIYVDGVAGPPVFGLDLARVVACQGIPKGLQAAIREGVVADEGVVDGRSE